jgi:methionyl-tRNA formyltransferase
MDDKVICIAGKNSIAINVLEFISLNYTNFKIVACVNKSDNFLNGWQKSFGLYCKRKNIEIVSLEDLYKIENLYLFSLEFDKLIDVSKFSSENLFNIHFSFLPSYKGMYTSALPILHGEYYTGVTLHYIDNGIDTGDIIEQVKIIIPENFNARDLYLEYLRVGENLFISYLDNLIKGDFSSIKQSNVNSTYYSKKSIDYKNLFIDFRKTASEIVNQIRAYSFREFQLPKVYGTSVYKAKILQSRSFKKPGEVISEDFFTVLISSIDYDVCIYKDKGTELLEAASKGDLKTIMYLQENGYNLLLKNESGWDILIISAYHGYLNIVKWLIETGLFSINSCNYKGTTVIMYAMNYAIRTNNREVFDYLISKGVDLSLKDDNGHDIYYYAQNNKFII